MSYSLDNHCRLCANISRKLRCIDSELGNQINLLLQVEIGEYEDDNLPKRICHRCLENVNNSWIFFNKVHKGQEKLEHIIKYEIKLEEYSDECTKDENICISGKHEDIPDLGEFAEMEKLIVETEFKQETSEEIIKFERDEEMFELENSSQEDEPLNPSVCWPDYPWICSICGEKCGDVRGYKNHHCFEFHKRYFCVDCPKAYSRQISFFTHVSDRHWNRLQAHLLLECDICHGWFHTKEKQEDHRKDEHPDAEPRIEPPRKEEKINNFDCPLCSKSFTSRSNLNFHQKVHSSLKEFTCDECGKSYSRKAVFLNHQRIHITGKEHTCEQCGRSFNQRCNLDEHMTLHSDVRPYACAVCARMFKTTRCLRRHEAIHSAVKPNMCDLCGREFKMRRALRDHLKTHETKKAFDCEYCGKSFGLKKVLQVHRRIHTGEQRYSCTMCDKRFAVWGHWRQHIKRVHTEIHDYIAEPGIS